MSTRLMEKEFTIQVVRVGYVAERGPITDSEELQMRIYSATHRASPTLLSCSVSSPLQLHTIRARILDFFITGF